MKYRAELNGHNYTVTEREQHTLGIVKRLLVHSANVGDKVNVQFDTIAELRKGTSHINTFRTHAGAFGLFTTVSTKVDNENKIFILTIEVIGNEK